MSAAFHIKDRKEHFTFVPEKYRNEVKIVVLLPIALACLTLLLLLGQHM